MISFALKERSSRNKLFILLCATMAIGSLHAGADIMEAQKPTGYSPLFGARGAGKTLKAPPKSKLPKTILQPMEVKEKESTDEYVDFPREEYEQYMKLIKELDPEVHETLQKCEKTLGYPCIEPAIGEEIDEVLPKSEETQGFPTMIFKSVKDYPEDVQKGLLKIPVEWYKAEMNKEMVTEMSTEERQKILQGFKTIDPDLYNAIIKVDPTGENHIKRSYIGGTWTLVSEVDGLPEFYFDQSVVDEPLNQMLCTLAHELAHYILGHFYEVYSLSHPQLVKEGAPYEEFKKGKKVAGQLPFKETFDKARQRSKENEADRMIVIDFGLPIDDAIAHAKHLLVKAEEEYLKLPHKETFQTTHPLWANRIKHFESLRSEAELRRAQKKQRKPVDYDALAKKYLKKYAKQSGSK